MRSALILGTFCLLVIATPSTRSETHQPEQIAKYVAKLSSQRFIEREKAAKMLESLGEPALKVLRDLSRSEEPDIRQRALLMLERIQKGIDNQKHIQAPKYRFSFKETQLRSAIAEMNRKTGLQLHLDEKKVADPKKPITLETGEVTAWEAVEKLMQIAKLKDNDTPVTNPNVNTSGRYREALIFDGRGYRPRNPEQANRIVLIDGNPDGPSCSSGILRVRALAKESSGKSTSQTSNEYNLTLEVTPSGNTTWQGTLEIEIRRAIDDQDQVLTQSQLRSQAPINGAFSEDGMIFMGGMQQQILIDWSDSAIQPTNVNPRRVPLTLFAGKKSAKMLKELEGVVHGRMMTAPEALVTLDDVLKTSQKQTFQAGKTTIQVLEARINEQGTGLVRVKMETPVNNNWGGGFPGGGFLVLDEMGMMSPNSMPQISLQDEKGKPLPRVRMEMLNVNNNGIVYSQEIQFHFSRSKDATGGVKLVATGQKQVEVSVPFVLKNVPLP